MAVWCVVAVAASALALVLAGTGPGYDPYGWLVWGTRTLHLSLDLAGAPSWKPLPALFTIPYALAGPSAVWLWMLTAVSLSLLGCVFAARIAHRLVQSGPALSPDAAPIPPVRWAPAVAATFAAVGVLLTQDYVHYILSGQSDPVIVTLCLAAIDFHLGRRYRCALAAVALGALGRPELWPFGTLYALWTWRYRPPLRWMVLAGVLVVPGLWFGIPWLTNGRPDVSAQLALNTPGVLRHQPVVGTLGLYLKLLPVPIWLLASAAAVLGARRRERALMTLGGAVLSWVLVEIVFAVRGYPVLPRFMFEGAATAAVLAGVALGRAAGAVAGAPRAACRWSGVAMTLLVAAALVPEAILRVDAERRDLSNQRERFAQITLLHAAVDRLGGPRAVVACGEPVTYVEYASALAWLTDRNVDQIGYKPARERRRRYPIVTFLPASTGGWTVQIWRTRVTGGPCARVKLTGASDETIALGSPTSG